MNRKALSPRTCRGCGLVFQPKTALDRYGSEQCKAEAAKRRGKHGRTEWAQYEKFKCRAVPFEAITHK